MLVYDLSFSGQEIPDDLSSEIENSEIVFVKKRYAYDAKMLFWS